MIVIAYGSPSKRKEPINVLARLVLSRGGPTLIYDFPIRLNVYREIRVVALNAFDHPGQGNSLPDTGICGATSLRLSAAIQSH